MLDSQALKTLYENALGSHPADQIASGRSTLEAASLLHSNALEAPFRALRYTTLAKGGSRQENALRAQGEAKNGLLQRSIRSLIRCQAGLQSTDKQR
jgi:hypothetical protein